MRSFKTMVGAAGMMILAACGGGNTITGKAVSSTSTSVSSIAVSSSTAQIAADGSTSATISAVAKATGNATVEGAVVTFTSSAGTISVTQGTTDVNGLATATLTAKGVAAGTSITVTAKSSGISGTTTVSVINIQQNITLITSLPQLPSDGSKSTTITALLTDANNNALPGILVTFNVSSGVLTVNTGTGETVPGTTDANGKATATLAVGADESNRSIKVTASAGTATSPILIVPVVGTTLTVTGPPTLVLGSSGTYTASVTNSSNVGIATIPVTLTSALGNTLSAATVTTNATGTATFTVTAAKSGNDTITGTALGTTATQAVSISSQVFAFTTPAASSATTPVNLGMNQTLAVTWTVNGAAQVGKTINFSATRGTLSAGSAVTDGTGTASVTISSLAAGTSTVTASATGVSAQQNLDFIATSPANIAVQASPATIPTSGQSTITATVRDASNNLVENQTVDFAITQDATGGTLSVATAQTDSQGRAQTVYTASTTPSATNGVIIQASVPSSSVVPQSADLTVGGLAVHLSLGTGNHLSENPSQTQFIVPYVVDALDAAGNAVPNAVITLEIHATYYYKGRYVAGTSAWVWTPSTPAGCENEDIDLTGIYNRYKDGFQDAGYATNPDYDSEGNQNGKLDPGGTATVSPGTVTTGSDGSATFNVEYPEDQANWITVQLTATTSVSGTETSARTTFQLPILASYLTTLTSSPPGQPSPYGVAGVCTNPN
jgi:hypothetical protein